MTQVAEPPTVCRGLLHCTLGLCCPCITLSSCMSGARNMISTQQWKYNDESDSSCKYCGIYNGVLFSVTMFVVGYDELRQSCCVPPVQTEMNR
jgi:hypothetical protein